MAPSFPILPVSLFMLCFCSAHLARISLLPASPLSEVCSASSIVNRQSCSASSDFTLQIRSLTLFLEHLLQTSLPSLFSLFPLLLPSLDHGDHFFCLHFCPFHLWGPFQLLSSSPSPSFSVPGRLKTSFSLHREAQNAQGNLGGIEESCGQGESQEETGTGTVTRGQRRE